MQPFRIGLLAQKQKTDVAIKCLHFYRNKTKATQKATTQPYLYMQQRVVQLKIYKFVK